MYSKSIKSILTKLINYIHLLISIYNYRFIDLYNFINKNVKRQDNAFTVTHINTTRLFHNLTYRKRFKTGDNISVICNKLGSDIIVPCRLFFSWDKKIKRFLKYDCSLVTSRDQ